MFQDVPPYFNLCSISNSIHVDEDTVKSPTMWCSLGQSNKKYLKHPLGFGLDFIDSHSQSSQIYNLNLFSMFDTIIPKSWTEFRRSVKVFEAGTREQSSCGIYKCDHEKQTVVERLWIAMFKQSEFSCHFCHHLYIDFQKYIFVASPLLGIVWQVSWVTGFGWGMKL